MRLTDAKRVITYETMCLWCNVLRRMVWVRDEGRDEVYACPHCHHERSVRVR